MKAHYNALKDDIQNSGGDIPGVLSIGQIEKYHEKYFEEIGLPYFTYGGSGVPDFIEEWVYGADSDPRS